MVEKLPLRHGIGIKVCFTRCDHPKLGSWLFIYGLGRQPSSYTLYMTRISWENQAWSSLRNIDPPPRLLVRRRLLCSIPNVALTLGARTKCCNLFQKAMIPYRNYSRSSGADESESIMPLCSIVWQQMGRGYNSTRLYVEIAAVWSNYIL